MLDTPADDASGDTPRSVPAPYGTVPGDTAPGVTPHTDAGGQATPQPARRPATFRGGPALGLSVFTFGTMLFALTGASVADLYLHSQLWGYSLTAFPILLLISIVVDAVAGVGGGGNRRLAVIGGLILLAPGLYLGGLFAYDALFNS